MSQVSREETWHRFTPGTGGTLDLDKRVHVWRARIDGASDGLIAALSDDEKARAARFHHEADRTHFIAARATLRMILATCLDMVDDPKGATLRFVYGAAGKPSLADHPKLFFNVSHSDNIALIAVTRTGEVGIDIECQRGMPDMASIARLVFDDAEKSALMGCPPEGREMIFYRTWTRKEALLKATGAGLAAIGDANAAAATHGLARLCLTALPHLDGYAAALARPRGAHGITLWSWPNAAAMRGTERRARHRTMPAPRQLAPHVFEARP